MRFIQKLKASINLFIRKAFYYNSNSQLLQRIIMNQYKIMRIHYDAKDLPSLDEVGFKSFSQFDEDGILLYIFSLVGTTNKRVVEICAGDGMECMSTNLILNHGWDALLFDGDYKNVKKGNSFFANMPQVFVHPPKFFQAWITKENVNDLISKNGFSGEIDLLSLDIDGNDYHIMESIQSVSPRVIVCETHNVIPPSLAYSIPYIPNFDYKDGSFHPEFRSVSLKAMQKLLREKGYRLIGSHRYGFNVFFLRNDVGQDYFPEVSVESVWDNSYSKSRMQKVWPIVKDMNWVDLDKN